MSRKALDEQLQKAEARMKELTAKKSKQKREERHAQLMSLGLLIEQIFTKLTPEIKAELQAAATALNERDKGRVLAAFERLSPTPQTDAPATPKPQATGQ